jgi:HEPN domain-containing protein
MNEAERLRETRRWLRYARQDLVAAEAMLGRVDMWPRHACWLAQQAAEKAIKSVSVTAPSAAVVYGGTRTTTLTKF